MDIKHILKRRPGKGLYEEVANFIFAMQNLLERMDKDGHLDEEKRLERTLDGVLPQISGQVMPYLPKKFEEFLEKSKLVEKALMKTARGEHAHYTADIGSTIKVGEDKRQIG
jgi:hypothetical protein